jgi:hypothetical protein
MCVLDSVKALWALWLQQAARPCAQSAPRMWRWCRLERLSAHPILDIRNVRIDGNGPSRCHSAGETILTKLSAPGLSTWLHILSQCSDNSQGDEHGARRRRPSQPQNRQRQESLSLCPRQGVPLLWQILCSAAITSPTGRALDRCLDSVAMHRLAALTPGIRAAGRRSSGSMFQPRTSKWAGALRVLPVCDSSSSAYRPLGSSRPPRMQPRRRHRRSQCRCLPCPPLGCLLLALASLPARAAG